MAETRPAHQVTVYHLGLRAVRSLASCGSQFIHVHTCIYICVCVCTYHVHVHVYAVDVHVPVVVGGLVPSFRIPSRARRHLGLCTREDRTASPAQSTAVATSTWPSSFTKSMWATIGLESWEGGGGERVRKEWNKEGDERNEGSREGKRIGRENRT